ncbi:ABC transporter substrate-binding protein [Pseudomonas sp. MYb185]|uniref:substrate-binding periplasmic protein n=1 Tax=Pseudomonas sp. MYb185 TaxID=1848729 RepID=UPI000CFBA681|nr:transporter substrate-binding domain-containing protein [Pseudomonas sp. MYb185]PRB84079.1 bifunctional lytic transglycosylase/amino acid ABC transporter substrate-binding protein [Pseudomonas sp. MYb185]
MKKAAVWLALFLLCSGVCTAAQQPVVQVAFLNFSGYAERDESGRVVGKGVDLTTRLLHEAGYRAELRILPAARIWLGLESGEVHVWPGMLNKPGLAEHTLQTERDLGRVGINLYHLPGTPPPRWPEDIQGKSLIMITNFTYTTALRQILSDPARDLTVHKSNSHVGAVQMLLRGRGDYLLDYRTQVSSALETLGMQALPSVGVAELPMRFVLSRQSGFAERLKTDLDAAFDRLQAQGVELDVTRQ